MDWHPPIQGRKPVKTGAERLSDETMEATKSGGGVTMRLRVTSIFFPFIYDRKHLFLQKTVCVERTIASIP